MAVDYHLPHTKAEALQQLKHWLRNKYGLDLSLFNDFLLEHYNVGLKQSLAEHWQYGDGLGYVSYVITEGIEDTLMKVLADA